MTQQNSTAQDLQQSIADLVDQARQEEREAIANYLIQIAPYQPTELRQFCQHLAMVVRRGEYVNPKFPPIRPGFQPE